MNESDERYCTAEDAIFDAFFLLMKEKPLERITVSDVIKKAGIVRSTFYNHYESIAALVSSAEDKTLRDIFNLMESFHPKNDKDMCRSYFLAICNYTRKNPFLSNLLQSPGGDSFFEKAIKMFHRYVSEISQTANNGDTHTVSSFYIAGAIGSTIGILHKWSAEDFSSPAEDIADILSQLFISGILPHLNAG
ncbi:MAG: TetR/AcrR family transcriptional regulator [Lachnospiraceae bacterium]|nr:TetR/AcrR family transcriptional regulator [Lachnospiraceae bacterium]